MERSETFTPLNGLRFLAALAVVIFHYSTRIDGYDRTPSMIQHLISKGPAAVGFFFVLSGFVLAYRHLRTSPHANSRKAFYWARFIRLYPVYLISLLLFLPIAVRQYLLASPPASGGQHTFILSAILSCLMLQSWTPLAQSWNGPSWSLSVEAFLYIIFPFIVLPLTRIRRRTSVIVLFAAWIIPSLFACAYDLHWIPAPIWRGYITNNPLLWTPLFVMGISATRLIPSWSRVAVGKAATLSTAAFIALIMICFWWPYAWIDVFVTGGIAPLFAAIIICFTRTSGWLTRLIGCTWLNRLGEASYIIYIFQAPLWHYWQESTNHLRHVPADSNFVAIWQFVVFVPVLVLVSLITRRFVESAFRGCLSNLRLLPVVQEMKILERVRVTSA